MMLVPYFVRNSDVHGQGLFAVMPIAPGTELWRFQSPVVIAIRILRFE